MKKLDYSFLDQFRIAHGAWGSKPGDDFGAFRILGPQAESLLVIMSPGDANEAIPWEHVSVSTKNRAPTWREMCFVKDLFWGEDEVVMQLHPAKSSYVNNHKFCLHLWKPLNETIPLPPSIAVGYKALGTLN